MNDEEGSRQNGIAALLEKYFSSCMDVRLAFLFGSAARGRLSRSSDVDVAVYFEGEYSSEEMNSLWRDLEGLLDRDVDLLVLNKDNPTLAWSAMRGIPLLIRDYTFYLEYRNDTAGKGSERGDYPTDCLCRNGAN